MCIPELNTLMFCFHVAVQFDGQELVYSNLFLTVWPAMLTEPSPRVMTPALMGRSSAKYIVTPDTSTASVA